MVRHGKMMRMDEPDEFISKTQRKKQATQLQDVGAALVELSIEQIKRMEMPEALREAVLDCKSITKHEARRRQMQWIGKLMRKMDCDRIAEQLSALEAPTKRQTALFHVAEKWRDDLMADPHAMARFEREFPHANSHRVRQLMEAAREERAAKRAPKHLRELFHAVNAAVQAAARNE